MTDPETRLAEAAKQCELAADELPTQIQTDTARALAALIHNLGKSVERVRDIDESELIADGGQEELLPWCDECEAFAVPDEDGACGECGSEVVLTDGGRDADLMALERRLDEQVEQQRRQADALEDLAERLQVQNGILFELITELDRRKSIAMTGIPDDAQMPSSRATGVQEGVTYLAENVDVAEATRWADE